jgi:hypothetical protein
MKKNPLRTLRLLCAREGGSEGVKDENPKSKIRHPKFPLPESSYMQLFLSL